MVSPSGAYREAVRKLKVLLGFVGSFGAMFGALECIFYVLGVFGHPEVGQRGAFREPMDILKVSRGFVARFGATL